jgi:death-on-curing family protein
MASQKIRFLTANQVKQLYANFIANAALTQPILLESAVQSPINVKYDGGQNNLFQLAAILSEKTMKNHAYQDGNKRLALVAADMSLKANGHKLTRDNNSDGLADAHVKVTTNQWPAERLGDYYQSIATPIVAINPEIQSYLDETAEK